MEDLNFIPFLDPRERERGRGWLNDEENHGDTEAERKGDWSIKN